jgi:hypothetical protein
VPELNDSYHLSDVIFADFVDSPLEEIFVVVEVEGDVKLRLELLPDVVRLGLRHCKFEFALELFVEDVS